MQKLGNDTAALVSAELAPLFGILHSALLTVPVVKLTNWLNDELREHERFFLHFVGRQRTGWPAWCLGRSLYKSVIEVPDL
mmetsp:Transcript_45065/g.119560  ORF Transcript_45065/g.119560 Transcript_45065/m.119560 type:complete len:81 (-) Transcript_45065:752-994(-)